jgi:ADP-dependent NAD(P)H-hydrate dehydratase / NAD(P)H-hydrate epimerase
MKILTPRQMFLADKSAIGIGVSSKILMENAGRAVSEFAINNYYEDAKKGVLILAGSGNNGGDGFVVGRVLLSYGFQVTILCLSKVEELKGDARVNADLLEKIFLQSIVHVDSKLNIDLYLKSVGLVIDALFGTGFKGELKEIPGKIVNKLNAECTRRYLPVISVDLPSGLDGETGEVYSECVMAKSTVALQCLKVGHVLFPGTTYCGDVFVADIGIPRTIPEIANISCELISEAYVREILLSNYNVNANSHKGSRGKVLIIGGSMGMYGAPKMTGQSSLMSGAGLVSLLLPSLVAQKIASQLTELICEALPDNGTGDFSKEASKEVVRHLEKWDCIVIGPGIGKSDGALQLVLETLKQAKSKIIIDADALNLLSTMSNAKDFINESMILTPHPGEMARLLGISTEDVQNDRLKYALKVSTEWGCFVVLKGARTIITGPNGEININPTAISSLSTAGSGDVLAGIIATLLARKIKIIDAIKCAVYVHGYAGEELAYEKGGTAGIVASDIIETVSQVINELSSEETMKHASLIEKALDKVV